MKSCGGKVLFRMSNGWPIGGHDDILVYLQQLYVSDMEHINMPGLLQDEALGKVAVVSSFGAESVVMLHYVSRILPDAPVLFIDTDKHFPETLAYRDLIVEMLGLDLRVIEPDARLIKREDSCGTLYTVDPNACCTIRKTFPLQDGLASYDCWISGRKRYQGGARSSLPILERDGEKIKVNPLAMWSEDDVSTYFKRYQLPSHPLEAENYRSVGCAPCTSPIGNDDDPRSGRWVRMPDKTECGIHLGPDGRFVRKGTYKLRGGM